MGFIVTGFEGLIGTPCGGDRVFKTPWEAQNYAKATYNYHSHMVYDLDTNTYVFTPNGMQSSDGAWQQVLKINLNTREKVEKELLDYTIMCANAHR